MANAAFRPAAFLVLTAFAVQVWAHDDGSADDMMKQLLKMRSSVHHQSQSHQQNNQQGSAQNYYDSQATGAGSASAGQQSYDASQQAARDYYDKQAQQAQPGAASAQQGYSDSQDTGGGMQAMTTHKPGFMGNSSPKNRAIVTGVVAGAGVAAVAGGIAIAIEEGKIQKRIKEGKPVKPIFPWMAGKKGIGAQLSGGGSQTGSRPALSARESTGDEGSSASVAPTLPPTVAPTVPPTTATTTAPSKLGDEIPLVVWIALGVLACCCLAALICACVEAIKHSGRKKRTVKAKKGDELTRSDSDLSSPRLSDEDGYASGDGSYYSPSSPSYAAVSPHGEQEQYYDPSAQQYDYSQQYLQQASYQTADQPQVSYQSAGGLSYSEYTPAASYSLTDGSQYTQASYLTEPSQYTANYTLPALSAQSYVPTLHHNPHPNASAYVDPQTGAYIYNTNS